MRFTIDLEVQENGFFKLLGWTARLKNERRNQFNIPAGSVIYVKNFRDTHIQQVVNGLPAGKHSVFIEAEDDAVVQGQDGKYGITLQSMEYILFGEQAYANLGDVYQDIQNKYLNDGLYSCAVLTDEDREVMMSEEVMEKILDYFILFDQLDFSEIDEHWNAEDNYKKEILPIYIIQKAYGYAAVYYKMFKGFLQKLFEQHPDRKVNFHLLSIGCGCKSDALAFGYAMREYRGKISTAKYIGLDPAAWNVDNGEFLFSLNYDDEFIQLREQDGRDLIEQEIWEINNLNLDEIDHDNEDSVYLVIFPNSISEIGDADVARLANAIKEKYQGKETYILCSRNPGNPDTGEETEDQTDAAIDASQIKTLKNVLHCDDAYSEDMQEKTGYIQDNLNDYYDMTGNIGWTVRTFHEKLQDIYQQVLNQQEDVLRSLWDDEFLTDEQKDSIERKIQGLSREGNMIKGGSIRSVIKSYKYCLHQIFKLPEE